MGRAPHLFKWAGSKRALLRDLEYFVPNEYGRYIEPFCGSCSLFFHLKPKTASLSDINSHLVNALSEVKKDHASIYRHLSSINWSKEEYYRIRQDSFSDDDASKRAADFIFLVRNSFNGLYRTNKNGKFNVPYAGSRSGFLPEKSVFEEASDLLRNTEIECGDFEEKLFSNVQRGDFVFLDPPYATNNRRIFRQYDPASFGVDDVRRLAECLEMVHARGAKFLLCYAQAPEIEFLRLRWNSSELEVRRNISGFKNSRGIQTETLLTNV